MSVIEVLEYHEDIFVSWRYLHEIQDHEENLGKPFTLVQLIEC